MKKFWLWLCGLIVVCGGGYWGYLATSGYLRAQYATGVAESYVQVQKIPKQNIIDFYPASYDTKSSNRQESQNSAALVLPLKGIYNMQKVSSHLSK